MDPQRFGRYEIKAEIGRGGMATVYHASDPRFEREVAIKVLPREMLHDPQFRTRFEREAKTVALLEHPAIVPVYDFGEEDGQPYFVMRYMTGGSLSDRMKSGLLPLPEVARIISRIAPALDEAHAKGIIHRDIKPGNILFDQYNEPYVSDFGIAKFAQSQTNVTGSAIVGTPAYMSPEQAQGEGNIDGRSDIYGLGVILFEMLTGQQPYAGDTPMSIVVKHITEPVPHILDVKPDLPTDVELVIEKAMAKDREQRFGSVRALSEALNAVARGATPDLSSASDVTRIAPAKTVASKGSSRAAQTVLTKQAARTETSPRKKGGAWVGIVIGLVVVSAIAVGGLLVFGKGLPLVAGLFPAFTDTPGSVRNTPTVELPAQVTETLPAVVVQPTDTATLTPTVAQPVNPVIGGADLIAFVSDNDIYIVRVDGIGLRRITEDGAEKRGLQWSPEGDRLFFLSGICIQYVLIQDGAVSNLACFNSAQFLEAFVISPDGTQVAIDLDRTIYIVPYDLEAIGQARNHASLRNMNGCYTYTVDTTGIGGGKIGAAPLDLRWSRDGNRVAIKIKAVEGDRQIELIRLLDISTCMTSPARMLDNFPGARFVMIGYNERPSIPFYDWDGESLFLLNSQFRYQSGYLYTYNLDRNMGKDLTPLGTNCCYSNATWSPDGTYILFAYQDLNSGTNPPTEVYYLPFGTIEAGGGHTSLQLPGDLFQSPNKPVSFALRPAR
jgi:serine/threonine protein kinase